MRTVGKGATTMIFARIGWPLVFVAGLAACSGNLGGGQSTLPGAPLPGTANVQQVAPPAATSTPSSASTVATVGDSDAAQALPLVAGWGGSIAFTKPTPAPSTSPNSKSTAVSIGSKSVSIGITSSIVEPSDSPHLGSASKRGAKREPGAVTALLFISLLATSDVTLATYPKIAINVPRDIASKHRDDIFALALYDPEEKQKTYRLAVAERDLTSPLPGDMPSPVATPVPTPIPSVTPFGMPNGPGALTPPPIGSELGSSGLPPELIAFQATASGLTLKADRPVVFALYVVAPSPSPSPSGSAAPPPSKGVPPSTASPQASSSPGPGPAAGLSPGITAPSSAAPSATPTAQP